MRTFLYNQDLRLLLTFLSDLSGKNIKKIVESIISFMMLQ